MRDTLVQRDPAAEMAPARWAYRAARRVLTDLREAALPLLWLAAGLAAATAYLVGADLVGVPVPMIAPVFPPTAVVLAVLLLTPPRHWWLYLLAAYAFRVATELWLDRLLWFALLLNAADVVMFVVAALLLRRWVDLPPRFASLREVSVYSASVLVGVALGATLGAAVRLGLGHPYWSSWWAWFLSDALAALLLAPTILLWIEAGRRGLRAGSRRRAAEAALLAAGLLVAGVVAFGTSGLGLSPDIAPAALYLPVPLLLWAAVRFDARGVVSALTLVTAIAVAGVANGLGPLGERSEAANLLLQHFLFAVGVPLFFLAVLVHERQGAHVALARSEARYRAAQAQREELARELAHVTRVAALGELVASIAHELGQPLAAIRNNAWTGRRFLAAPGPGGPDLAGLDAILADIGADDERATAVIVRLRALLRKSEGEHVPLDLNAAVAETVGLVSTDAARRGVALTLDLDAALPLVVGDRVQLQQVVLNLLLNGLDAAAGPVSPGGGRTPAGGRPRPTELPGTLTVQTRYAAGPASTGAPQGAVADVGGTVEVAVRDSGPGLGGAAADRLFEPFYTTKPGGLGMGLAISRTIAEAHGGALRAATAATGGAVFTLALPIVSPRPAPGVGRPSADGGGG